jgi:hypothetical protein
MLNIFGFDNTDPANIGWTGGTFSRETSIVRNGTHSYKGTGTISSATSPNFGNKATIYAGVAIYWQSVASAAKCIAFVDGSTLQVCVTIETDGTLKVRRGTESGTVLCSSSSGVFTVNTWHHLQLYCVVNGASGAVELRLNGTNVASASGINTSNSGNAYANKFALYGCAGFNYAYYDDCWISDTAFQGDCKVETIYPSANGTTNNFNLSGAASNYLCVDESGEYNSDTDYTYDANVGDKDLFAMGNLATVSGTVKGVRINTVMRKDDTGTKQAAMMVRNGGVNSQRTTQTLTTSYVVYQEDLTVDPSDGAAWSISKVNSMELGVVVVT